MTGEERREHGSARLSFVMIKMALLFSMGVTVTQGFTPTATTIRYTSSDHSSSSRRITSSWHSKRPPYTRLYHQSTSDAPVANATLGGVAMTVNGAEAPSHESPDSLKNMLRFALPALGIYLSNPMLSNIDNGT